MALIAKIAALPKMCIKETWSEPRRRCLLNLAWNEELSNADDSYASLINLHSTLNYEGEANKDFNY